MSFIQNEEFKQLEQQRLQKLQKPMKVKVTFSQIIVL